MKIVFEGSVYFIYNFKTISNLEIVDRDCIGTKNDPFLKMDLHKMFFIYIDKNGKRNVSFLFFTEKEFQDIYLKIQKEMRPFLIIFKEDFSELKEALEFPQEPMFSLTCPDSLKNKESQFFQEILKEIRKP